LATFDIYLSALEYIVVVAIIAWAVSVVKRDVSIVDSLWSLFFLLAAVLFAAQAPELGARGVLVLVLTAAWALRLSVYITVRNWGEPEDYRYRNIRAQNEPYFVIKSLLIVFGLQGLLAWVISIPLLYGISAPADLGVVDGLAAALWLVGMVFEAVGDYQLSKFKADPANRDRVMDRGLWRYSRHPNYFGNACIWWAFYLFALGAGAWWTFYAPALMTFLLLRVSGVAMLERTISRRRPGYSDYIRQTNAFIPGPRRRATVRGGAGA
jgi:steroid 5-alpha reductase family enzyme